MCSLIGCITSKSFNFSGLRAEYCGVHKLDGMSNTKHEICDECPKQASYGFIADNLRVKCGSHKTSDMINLKTKNIKCKDNDCKNTVYKYDGYCSLCCKLTNTKHDDTSETDLQSISKKEYNILRFLQQNFKHKIYWNKQIKLAVHPHATEIHKRPDFRMDLGTFQIIIENDEDQHKRYNKHTEIERLDEIYNYVNVPLYIVRFNPDKYINNDVVVNGCFSNNSVSNPTEWANRLDKLKTTIEECINKGACSSQKYEIIYLFYDNLF